MSRDLSKLGGIIQALFGAAGKFIPGAADVLSPQQPMTPPGNIFNMVSGALLFLVSFGSSGFTKVCGVIIGLVNAAAGVLVLTNKTNLIPGFQLNGGTPQTVLYFAIAAIGLLSVFIRKKK
jgi:hypothetical protein